MFDTAHRETEHGGQSTIDADRSVKIERLLLSGLDHYFRGRYEHAIDLWTRVLFLDRQHARARAYIDRARAALSERLRESEELLHSGAEAFERGDVGAARALLTSAVERGGGRDEALALLDRMNRLEGASSDQVTPRRARHRVLGGGRQVDRHGGTSRAVRVAPLVFLAAVAALAGYVAMTWEQWEPVLLGSPAFSAVQVPGAAGEPLPVPSADDLALERARRLADGGAPRQALAVLDRITVGSSAAGDADALRAELQRELMSEIGDVLELDPVASVGPAQP